MKPKTKTAARKGDTAPVQIGIPTADRTKVITLLQAILADQHVLYLKTRNFHWNLTGPRFSSLHELFEQQYQALELAIDETAERIRMIGGTSQGSMAEFLKLATLKECAGALIPGEEAIKLLKLDHEAAIRALRSGIEAADQSDDIGTADFLTDLIRNHEKHAWMLRSFLE